MSAPLVIICTQNKKQMSKYKISPFTNNSIVICKIIVGNGLCAVPHCKTKQERHIGRSLQEKEKDI